VRVGLQPSTETVKWLAGLARAVHIVFGPVVAAELVAVDDEVCQVRIKADFGFAEREEHALFAVRGLANCVEVYGGAEAWRAEERVECVKIAWPFAQILFLPLRAVVLLEKVHPFKLTNLSRGVGETVDELEHHIAAARYLVVVGVDRWASSEGLEMRGILAAMHRLNSLTYCSMIGLGTLG